MVKLQRLMRHATINLTKQYYVHLDVDALDAGLNLLPSVEGGPDRLPSRRADPRPEAGRERA